MATIHSSSLLSLAVLAAIAAASRGGAGSTLTVYDQSECGGHSCTYSTCGCHQIDYRAGYTFSFAGGVMADLYDSTDCSGGGGGNDERHLDENEMHCGSFAFQSVNMCSSYHPLQLGNGPRSPTTMPLEPQAPLLLS
uniref:Antimicrobial peptide 1 n=1 Tax=Anthurium amnicola TaxID=1678845 RepID=A0A1D1XRK9_9ARAE